MQACGTKQRSLIIKMMALLIVCSFTLLLPQAIADNTSSQGGAADTKAMAGFDLSKGAIQITAEKLVASQGENMAWFEGNVVAIQDKTTINAHTLKIWYSQEGGEPNDQSGLPSTQTLEKIVALGEVTITNDAFSSQSYDALYTQEDGNLVLTGSPAVVVSGKNKVTGSKITRTRQGVLTFEGGVTAEFFPEESEEDTEKAGE